MTDKADPSNEDIYRLLDMYLAMDKPKADRCERCGWPLKATIAEGCTKGNCSMRPLMDAGNKVAEIFQ